MMAVSGYVEHYKYDYYYYYYYYYYYLISDYFSIFSLKVCYILIIPSIVQIMMLAVWLCYVCTEK